MSISSVLPETNCNIPMPQVNLSGEKSCERCIKKSVCKYKERAEEAIAHINNLLSGDDEQFTGLPLAIDVRCKEFSLGYDSYR